MRRLLLLASFLAACTSTTPPGDDDQGDDDAPAIDAAPPGGGDPRTGQWHYDEYAVSGGGCDVGDELNQDGDFGLVNHGDGTFTVTPGDGSDPFTCTLDGSDFACPDRATADYSQGGVAAVLHGEARADGTFTSDEDGAGEQTIDVTCTGADCGAVEAALGVDFPCTLVADFEISWRSL